MSDDIYEPTRAWSYCLISIAQCWYINITPKFPRQEVKDNVTRRVASAGVKYRAYEVVDAINDDESVRQSMFFIL